MDIRTAPAEHLAQAEGCGHQQEEQHQAEQGRLLAQWRVAEEVVDKPAADQGADANGDSGRRAQVATGRNQ
ncbi:hypothetical protein DAPPUDRAFT_346641, partial [Daphnia pulex]